MKMFHNNVQMDSNINQRMFQKHLTTWKIQYQEQKSIHSLWNEKTHSSKNGMYCEKIDFALFSLQSNTNVLGHRSQTFSPFSYCTWCFIYGIKNHTTTTNVHLDFLTRCNIRAHRYVYVRKIDINNVLFLSYNMKHPIPSIFDCTL